MIFSSFDFIFFFISIYLFYYLVPAKLRWLLLLIGSYFFYMYWEPSYIILIITSTLIDYLVSKRLAKTSGRKIRIRLLLLSIVSNLGLLFTFKYFNFFNEIIFDVGELFGYDYSVNKLDLLLPVGISFYTFQTLSYTIDVYRKKITPERHLGKFALYVSFFPQLVAGPIERASNLLPQIGRVSKLKFNSDQFISGFTQVLFGFFKKVVVADTLAIYVDSIYNNYQYHSGFSLLFATYMFAFQIYCDFSGYSDIAIGSARMMGFDFKENFKLPYFSKSITEFWRRWHISLSSWLRDYLYIPLGGSRGRIKVLTYRNLMITMLLGGLWHGASWNFIIWGGLNGLYLAIEKIFGKRIGYLKSVKPLRLFVTFNLICLTWIFFRSSTLDQSWAILTNLFSQEHFWNLKIQDTGVFASMIFNLSIMLLVEYFFLRKSDYNRLTKKYNSRLFIPSAIVFILIVIFGVEDGSQFIYFQF